MRLLDKPYNLILTLIIFLVGALQAALFMFGLLVGDSTLWMMIGFGGGAVVLFFVGLYWHYDQRKRRRRQSVKDVHLTEEVLSVDLVDGRTITVPLAWYPRLLHATAEQRANWKVSGGGDGIHWPDIDEDLSTEGLLRGAPAPHGTTSVRA